MQKTTAAGWFLSPHPERPTHRPTKDSCPNAGPETACPARHSGWPGETAAAGKAARWAFIARAHRALPHLRIAAVYASTGMLGHGLLAVLARSG